MVLCQLENGEILVSTASCRREHIPLLHLPLAVAFGYTIIRVHVYSVDFFKTNLATLTMSQTKVIARLVFWHAMWPDPDCCGM